MDKIDEPYLCDICKKLFFDPKSLSQHKINEHTQSHNITTNVKIYYSKSNTQPVTESVPQDKYYTTDPLLDVCKEVFDRMDKIRKDLKELWKRYEEEKPLTKQSYPKFIEERLSILERMRPDCAEYKSEYEKYEKNYNIFKEKFIEPHKRYLQSLKNELERRKTEFISHYQLKLSDLQEISILLGWLSEFKDTLPADMRKKLDDYNTQWSEFKDDTEKYKRSIENDLETFIKNINEVDKLLQKLNFIGEESHEWEEDEIESELPAQKPDEVRIIPQRIRRCKKCNKEMLCVE